ncbi:MAG TPA: hypothetical protein VF815_14545 [Myxococcaceae bacterium]
MSTRREPPGRSGWGLRLIHAAVFLAFAAAVSITAFPEWRHTVAALGRPYHVGEPPRAFLLLGSAVALAGAVGLLAALVRGRSAPAFASWFILGGLVAGIFGASGPLPPVRPSEIAANTELIQVGQRVQAFMVSQLQERGEVPVAREPWQRALEHTASPLRWPRTRDFRPVPPQVVQVATPEARPEPLTPGALLLHVSPDGAAFELRLVGLEAGRPKILADDTGAAIVLRGLYNPELPSEPGRLVP